MKITKRQLKRIIREAINSNLRLDATHEEDQEYDLGYEDGLNGLPNDVQNSDYPDAYTAGYEDGVGRATGKYKVPAGVEMVSLK
jgi:hypothetical protein